MSRFVQVSTGDGHSCAVRADDTITCWGNNNAGQVDAPPERFRAVTAGSASSCGLHVYSRARCWGSREGTPLERLESVDAGADHACGVLIDGTAACWGDSHGQMHAFGEDPSGYEPHIRDVPPWLFESVTVDRDHACGVRPGGAVECWGDNSVRQLAAPAWPFTGIDASYLHTCGLRADAAMVVCWGRVDPHPPNHQATLRCF